MIQKFSVRQHTCKMKYLFLFGKDRYHNFIYWLPCVNEMYIYIGVLLITCIMHAYLLCETKKSK